MRSDDELRAFVRRELLPAAARWQEELRARRTPKTWMLVVGGLLLASCLPLRSLTPLGLLLFLAFAHYGPIALQTRASFKRDLVRRLVTFALPGAEYTPNGSIPARLVRESGLFSERFDAVSGEDLVSGVVGSTRFSFSEVSLSRKDGKRRETVFHGLFFEADAPKAFRGRTLCLPDRAERSLGVLGRAFQGISAGAGLELVELEDPEFERHFVCTATDPTEARYLLSPSLQERLVAFREKRDGAVRLSFVDSRVHVALPLGHDLFEPTALAASAGELPGEMAFLTYAEELRLGVGIVEDLDLDTRVWSKPAP